MKESHFSETVENPLPALESVRSILAIAIAAESRTTPLIHRQYYMDTADRMRRCARRLKKDGGQPLSQKGSLLFREILDAASPESDARRICSIVSDILEELES